MTEVSFIAIISRLCVAFHEDEDFYNKVDEVFGSGFFEPFAEHSHLNLVISAIARGFKNVDAVEEELCYFFYECNDNFDEYNNNMAACNNNWTVIKNFHEYYNYLREL